MSRWLGWIPLLLTMVACSNGASETETTDDHLDGVRLADVRLATGLERLRRVTTTVQIEETPVSWVYAGGQMIKRKGAPVGSQIVGASSIAKLLDVTSTPPFPPTCGALYPTSETEIVFRDEANHTVGYLFVDSNHCRDNIGVPGDGIGASILNLPVIVDWLTLDRLLEPPPTP